MAENSLIDWTDDTLNYSIGCNEVRFFVSGEVAHLLRAQGGAVIEVVEPDGHIRYALPSECDNCYAKVWARNRFEGGHRGQDAEHRVLWGNPKETPRHQTRDWRAKVRRFNRLAKEGGRRLCFAESLADWAEEHDMLTPWRDEFLRMASEATYVDWLLLTKRPQNVLRMVPSEWRQLWPRNIWIGYSAGTRQSMKIRAHYAAEFRGAGCPVVFVSVEPQLEDVDVTQAIRDGANWFITGGESGSGEDRPRVDADPDWFRRVRDVCLDNGVAYFHKQSGGVRPGTGKELDGRLWHQWPDTQMGQVGGVRVSDSAELIHSWT